MDLTKDNSVSQTWRISLLSLLTLVNQFQEDGTCLNLTRQSIMRSFKGLYTMDWISRSGPRFTWCLT
jgi:hypothetical protein